LSSHHIVRDQQEPALILADLDAFPFDLLGQLLEWAPFTVCGDEALDQALKYEINLDVVYTHRQNAEVLLSHFPGVQILRPNENWLEEAISFLMSKGHKAVNVIVSEGFEDLDLMHRISRHMLVDVISPTMKYVRIEGEFSKWMTAGSRLKVLGIEQFQVTGAEVNGTEITVISDGLVKIQSEKAVIIALITF
jgi:thiamine pyrophosphokinase